MKWVNRKFLLHVHNGIHYQWSSSSTINVLESFPFDFFYKTNMNGILIYKEHNMNDILTYIVNFSNTVLATHEFIVRLAI